MKVDIQPAIDLIREFEGCRLEAYQDIGGVWTIGYGTTGPMIVEGLVITQDHADELLYAHVVTLEAKILECVTRGLNQNQVCALLSFTYNVGFEALKSSTLLKLVNTKNDALAANEFLRWNKVRGDVVNGLCRRRQAEADLFSKPVT